MQVHPEGDRRLVIRRHFDAPPERVFERMTDPAWLKRWLGTAAHPLEHAVFEAEAGGEIVLSWGGEGGPQPRRGRVVAVMAPHLIRHEEWPAPDSAGGAAEVETRLLAEGDGTKMEQVIAYATGSARDRAMALSVPEEMELSFARLDGMLAP